jgi:hypothetical protein
MLTDILLYVGLVLGGGVAALKFIAPRTKTKVDDEVLHYGEVALEVLEGLGVKVPEGVEIKAVAVKVS